MQMKNNMGIDLNQAREKGLSPLLEEYFLKPFRPVFRYHRSLSEEEKKVFQNILEDLTQINETSVEATLIKADDILKKGYLIAEKVLINFVTPIHKIPVKPDPPKKAFTFNLKSYRKAGLSKILKWKLLLKFRHIFFKYSDYLTDQNKEELHQMFTKLTQIPDQSDLTNPLFKIDETFQKISIIAKEAEQRYQHLKETKNSDLSERKLHQLLPRLGPGIKIIQDMQIEINMGVDLVGAREKGLSPVLEEYFLRPFRPVFRHYRSLSEEEKKVFQNILEDLTQIKEPSLEATLIKADDILKKGYLIAEKVLINFVIPSLPRKLRANVPKKAFKFSLQSYRKAGLSKMLEWKFLLKFGHVFFKYSDYLSDQNKENLNSTFLELAKADSTNLLTIDKIFQKISVIVKEAEQRYQSLKKTENSDLSEKRLLQLINKQSSNRQTLYDLQIKTNMGLDLIQAREKGLSLLLEEYFLIPFRPMFRYHERFSEEDKEVFQNILEDLTQIKETSLEATFIKADNLFKKGYLIAEKVLINFVTPVRKIKIKTDPPKKPFKFSLQPYRRVGLSNILEWQLLLKFGHVFFKYSDHLSDQNKEDLNRILSELAKADSTNLLRIDEDFQKISTIAKEAEQRYQHLKETENSDLSEKKLLQLIKNQGSNRQTLYDLQIKTNMGIDLTQAREKGLSRLLEEYFLIPFRLAFKYHRHLSKEDKKVFQNILKELTQIKETSLEATFIQADAILKKGFLIVEKALISFVTPSFSSRFKADVLKKTFKFNLNPYRKAGLSKILEWKFLLKFGHVFFKYSDHLSDQNKEKLHQMLTKLSQIPAQADPTNPPFEVDDTFQKISIIAKEAEQRYQSSKETENSDLSEKKLLQLINEPDPNRQTLYDLKIKANMGIDLTQAREKGLSPLLEEYFLIPFKPVFRYHRRLSEKEKQVFQNILEDLTQIKEPSLEATFIKADAIFKKGFPIAEKVFINFVIPSPIRKFRTDLPKKTVQKQEELKKLFNSNLQPYRKAGLSKILEWKLLLRFEHMFFKYSNHLSDQNKENFNSTLLELAKADSINLFTIDKIFQKISIIAKEVEQRYQASKEHDTSPVSTEERELLQLMNKQASSDEKTEQDLQIKQDMGINLAQARKKGLSPLLEKQFLITFGEMFLNYHMYFPPAEKQIFQDIVRDLTRIKKTSPEATSAQADVVLRRGYPAAEKAKRRTVGYNACYKIFETKFIQTEF